MPDGDVAHHHTPTAAISPASPDIIALCDEIVEADRRAAEAFFGNPEQATTNEERTVRWNNQKVAATRIEALLRTAATIPAHTLEELAAKGRVMLTWCGVWDETRQHSMPEFTNNPHQMFGWWFAQDMIAAAAARAAPSTTLPISDATPALLAAARAFMNGETQAHDVATAAADVDVEADLTDAQNATIENIRREQHRHMTTMAGIRSAGRTDIVLKARVLDTFVSDNLGARANPLNCDGLIRSLLNDHLVTKKERHPDAELLHLGCLLEAAWRIESASWTLFQEAGSSDVQFFDEIHTRDYRAVSDLVDRIEATPALTLEGLRVKARAFRWFNEDEQINAELLSGMPSRNTDTALAAGIIQDLLAMGDAA